MIPFSEFRMRRVVFLFLAALVSGCSQPSNATQNKFEPVSYTLPTETPKPGAAERATPTRTGSDWPRLLGERGDGVSPETGILNAWPKVGLKKLWDCKLGAGYAPPSIVNGKLYHFDRFADIAQLTCRHAETGELIWVYDYPTEYQDLYGYDAGPRAGPVVDGDQLFLHGVDGMVIAVNAADGKEQWKVDTKKTYHVHQNFFGAGSVPLVVGQLVIVPIGGSPKGARPADLRDAKGDGSGIVAFDSKTGAEKYKFSDELASYSSPVLATFHGEKTVLYFARGGLLGFDPASGKERFNYKWRAKILESVNAANPVVVENRILITECYEKGTVCLEVQKDFTLKDIWSDLEKDKNDKALMAHWCTPMVDGQYMYGCSSRHSPQADFRCVELATGQVRWIEPKTRWTTAIKIDGHLLTLAEEGTLTLLKLNPDKYEKVAQWTSEQNPDLEYPCWAPPVVSRGLLYVRGKGKLVCYELK